MVQVVSCICVTDKTQLLVFLLNFVVCTSPSFAHSEIVNEAEECLERCKFK